LRKDAVVRMINKYSESNQGLVCFVYCTFTYAALSLRKPGYQCRNKKHQTQTGQNKMFTFWKVTNNTPCLSVRLISSWI